MDLEWDLSHINTELESGFSHHVVSPIGFTHIVVSPFGFTHELLRGFYAHMIHNSHNTETINDQRYPQIKGVCQNSGWCCGGEKGAITNFPYGKRRKNTSRVPETTLFFPPFQTTS